MKKEYYATLQVLAKKLISAGLLLILIFISNSINAQFGTSPWAAPSGSYSVPSGVTSISVECWGGGGGGGGAKSSSGGDASAGGGGGGAYSITTVTVTPGQNIVVAVGGGGAAGASNGGSGGNGVSSTLSYNSAIVAQAVGGTGGTGSTSGSKAGGAGGLTGSGTVHRGGSGGSGYVGGSFDFGGGGGGGGGSTAVGGNGTTSTGSPVAPAPGGPGGANGGGTGGNGYQGLGGNGSAGSTFGGGGGGAAGYNGASGSGGAGATGQVLITYTVPVFSISSVSPSSGCAGSTITITGVNLAGATAVTVGGTPVASITSNTATQIVAVLGSGSSGLVAVTNSFGTTSSPTSFTVTTIPTQPLSISGSTSICANSTNVYNVAAVSGATSYVWTIPSGWSGTSTTNSISTVADTSGGTVSVIATNACGSSTPQTVNVTYIPAPTVTLSALGTVCVNAPSYTLTGGSPAGGTFSGNGVSVGNIFNPSIAGAGTFPIVYTYHYGSCSKTASSTITVSTCSGIASSYMNDDVNVYPNPFKEYTTVSIGSSVQLTGAAFYLYDVLGKQVKVISNIHSYEIKLERNNLPSGLYFYRFVNNNKQLSSGKLILE